MMTESGSSLPTFESPQAALRRLGRTASRKLGQNFLQRLERAAALVESLDLDGTLPVLEVGPGLGAMTLPLASVTRSLTCWELDEQLAEDLRRRFASSKHVRIESADALKRDPTLDFPDSAEFCVVGNLPYNQATPIMFRFLELRARIPKMGFMVQHEVAARLTADAGTKDYGRLRILPSIFYDIQEAVRLHPGDFHPPPEVRSTFLVWHRREKPLVDFPSKGDLVVFERLISGIFQWRRKKLRNVLDLMGHSREEGAAILQAADISGDVRGETLEIPDLARLARELPRR